jgi:hypothetical protein
MSRNDATSEPSQKLAKANQSRKAHAQQRRHSSRQQTTHSFSTNDGTTEVQLVDRELRSNKLLLQKKTLNSNDQAYPVLRCNACKVLDQGQRVTPAERLKSVPQRKILPLHHLSSTF